MPGLTLVCNVAPSRDGWTSREPILLPQYAGYERHVVFAEPCAFLGYSAYPGYPFIVFESLNVQVALEGRAYGSSTQLKSCLLSLSEALLSGTPGARGDLARWVSEADGEFVGVARSKQTGHIAVFADHLCRLPLLWAESNDGIVVSRHPEALIRTLSSALDEMAAAQTLVFSYPLRTRTLFRNVRVLGPGSVLMMRPGDKHATLHEPRPPSVEDKSLITDLGSTADEIASLLVDATVRRASTAHANVVSLSGGLDSRVVAVALQTFHGDVAGATVVDHEGRLAADVPTARALAATLGLAWQLYELPPVSGGDALELLRLKGGANPLNMAFLLPYLRRLASRHGSRAVMFTGDGGDKVLPDLRPPRFIRTLEELALHVVDEHGIFSLEEAAAMSGVRPDDIVGELETVLASYPERDLAQKYVHFILFERGRRWLYEGEDRNRAFMWSTTPFYATDVFRRCMEAPDTLKARYKLYRAVLRRLSPAASKIVNASWGLPADSHAAGLQLLVRSWYRRVPATAKRLIGKLRGLRQRRAYAMPDGALRCLDDMVAAMKTRPGQLNVADMQRLQASRGRDGLHLVFTLVALEQWTLYESSCLQDYASQSVL